MINRLFKPFAGLFLLLCSFFVQASDSCSTKSDCIAESKIDLNYARNVLVSFSFTPRNDFHSWIDGNLIKLKDSTGQQLLKLDLVRRGRIRLQSGNKAAITPVINWRHGESRKIQLLFYGKKVSLQINNQTYAKLDYSRSKATVLIILGESTVAGPATIHGKFGTISNNTLTEFKLAPPVDWSKACRYGKKLLAYEKCFVEPIDPPPAPVLQTNEKIITRISGRIALDSLWARIYNNKKVHLEKYLKGLDNLVAKLGSGNLSIKAIPLPQRNNSIPWLSEKDQDYYFGGIGWSVGCYIPDFARIGFNLVSTSIWPNCIFDNAGKFKDDFINNNLLPQLRLAKCYGITVDVLLSPYTPQYLLWQHPEWEGKVAGYGAPDSEVEQAEKKSRTAGHGFLKASILADDYRDMCRKFIDYTLPKIKSSPAIGAICLGNEIQFEDYSAKAQAQFREFLQKKYQSVVELNASWKTNYPDFSAVFINRATGLDRTNTERFEDWLVFNWQCGTDYIRFLKREVEKIAPELPIHVKTLPYEFGLPWMKPGSNGRNSYDYADGVDRLRLVGLSNFAGTDSWGDNINGENALSTNTVYQSMYFELIRNYSFPPKPIFDSEWHIINTHQPTPPDYAEAVMKIDVISGLRAGTLWVAHPLIDNADFISDGPLLARCAKTSVGIRRHAEFFQMLSNRKQPVAILYSPRSRYLQGDSYVLAMKRLFEVGLYTGIGVRLLDERQLIAGKTEEIKSIITINCNNPLPATMKALKDFADSGKLVIQIGSLGNNSLRGKNIYKKTFTNSFTPLFDLYKKIAGMVKSKPLISIVNNKGKTPEGLQWSTVDDGKGNQLIFAVNISRKPMELSIKSRGSLYRIEDRRQISKHFSLPVLGTFSAILKQSNN